VNVRFTPKSGHWNSVAECPLCARSGHYHHPKTGMFRLKELCANAQIRHAV